MFTGLAGVVSVVACIDDVILAVVLIIGEAVNPIAS
jgi:hypothetical protein